MKKLILLFLLLLSPLTVKAQDIPTQAPKSGVYDPSGYLSQETINRIKEINNKYAETDLKPQIGIVIMNEIDGNIEQVADFEKGFTDKKDEITFNNTKYVFKEKLPDQDGIRTYVYEELHSEVPSDSPTIEIPELKVTRFVDEQGNDLHELVKDFVEKLDIDGYVFKETKETSDIRTHIYTKIETEIPNDSPVVEVPELKITKFIDINGNDIHDLVKEFVNKLDIDGYDFVETKETEDIRTHVYKKHVEPVAPTDNKSQSETITKNDTVESSVPTGDNINNTLRMFTLSMLGLCVAYVFKEKIK